MSAPFATPAWAEQLADRLRDSATVRTQSMSWVFGPLVLVVDADAEHDFEAAALRIDLHEGASRGVRVMPVSGVVQTPFAIGGSLARWKAVFGGAQAIVGGVLDSRLRLKGDLPTLMRHRSLLDAVAAEGGSIETAWQDEAEPAPA